MWRRAGATRSSISCIFGAPEGRNPAPDFDIKFYMNRYGAHAGRAEPAAALSRQPRERRVFLPQRPEHEGLVPAAVQPRDPAVRAFRGSSGQCPRSAERQAKLLAYYLPQFHQRAGE